MKVKRLSDGKEFTAKLINRYMNSSGTGDKLVNREKILSAIYIEGLGEFEPIADDMWGNQNNSSECFIEILEN